MAFPLPLFPLTVVLYPGMRLPLHIFEPRYRRMLADALEGGRRFGIAPPRDGTEPPPLDSVGCMAQITEVATLPDGRANIMTVGGTRYTVRAYLEGDRPYLLAEVESLDDTGPDADAAEMGRLQETLRRYLAVLEAWDDRVTLPDAWSEAPGAYTFQVASVAHLDLGEKQRLLEMVSSRDRARRLAELLPPLTTRLAAAVDARHRATGNGRAPPRGSLPGSA